MGFIADRHLPAKFSGGTVHSLGSGSRSQIAIASAAAGFEGFAAKIGEPSRIDECDILLEKFYELLLFVCPGAPPIAAKNKPGYTDPVEIIVEQLPEPRLP